MGRTTRTGRAGTFHIHPTTTSVDRTVAVDSPARRTRRGRRAAALAGLVALGLSACGGEDHDTTEQFAQEVPAATTFAAQPADEVLSVGSGDDTAATEPSTGSAKQTGAPIDLTYNRDLVVEAGITMLTPDVGVAVNDVIKIAGENGGAVFNADVTIEDPLDDGSVPGGGHIVIKIPPTRLDGLIADLQGVGDLRNQTQSVDDVTDQLIDLDIQIRQARESVERMEALLAETTDFNALVAAETELVQRQTAYERLLAAQRTIGDRVALSTLTVNVQYRSPLLDNNAAVEEEAGKGLRDALNDGWNAFAVVLFGLAFLLAVTAPFLAVGLVVVLVAWLINRGLRRRRAVERNRHEPLDSPVDDPLTSPTSAEASSASGEM